MIEDIQNNRIMVFEIEPDPQAADRLKEIVAQFTASAVKSVPNGGLVLATANNLPSPPLDPALLSRFDKLMHFTPPGPAMVEKTAQRETNRLLDNQHLTDRQRNAASAFIMGKAASLYDPADGFRGMVQSIKTLMQGNEFAELIEDHSTTTAKRNFEKAIKGGAKKAGAAPATARFTRRRTP